MVSENTLSTITNLKLSIVDKQILECSERCIIEKYNDNDKVYVKIPYDPSQINIENCKFSIDSLPENLILLIENEKQIYSFNRKTMHMASELIEIILEEKE